MKGEEYGNSPSGSLDGDVNGLTMANLLTTFR